MYFRIVCVLVFYLTACRAQQSATPQTQVIKEEVKKPVAQEKKDSVPTPAAKEKVYTFMLLLSVDLSDAFRTDSVSPDSLYFAEPIDKNIISSIDFYEGALQAVDSLRKTGYDIHLTVIDLSGDEQAQISQIRKLKYENTNAVFSMLREKPLHVLSEILLQKKTPLISCAANTTSSVKNNGNAICLQPSSITQCKQMGAFSKNNFNNDHFVIVTGNSEKEAERANVFISELDNKIEANHIKKVNFTLEGGKKFSNSLSLSNTNTLFIPSTDEDFVTTIFACIDSFSSVHRFRVIGLPVWQYFESLDPLLMEKFNTHIFTSEYCFYNEVRTIKFREKFRTLFSAEPGDASYLAYDAFLFIGNLIIKNQLPALDNSEYKFDGLRSSYRLSRTAQEAPFENKYIHVLKINDFHFIKINNLE